MKTAPQQTEPNKPGYELDCGIAVKVRTSVTNRRDRGTGMQVTGFIEQPEESDNSTDVADMETGWSREDTGELTREEEPRRRLGNTLETEVNQRRMIASVKELLMNSLRELGKDELKLFQWHLKNHDRISASEMENADILDTVDTMVACFEPEEAVKITVNILRKMNQNLLAEQLENKELGRNSSILASSRCNQRIEMSFKMAELDRFSGHRMEDLGARKRGSISLSIEKHPRCFMREDTQPIRHVKSALELVGPSGHQIILIGCSDTATCWATLDTDAADVSQPRSLLSSPLVRRRRLGVFWPLEFELVGLKYKVMQSVLMSSSSVKLAIYSQIRASRINNS
ncbi:hypothetical protein DPX16_23317 [Anabarilius grahami]|uniref:Pyrin domain-containing protein n=1 Tax=Anabarilius grahami TaxID=495550 RepID=A0A3N0Z8T7_ANAGA|nr:hypothetical protein DPX16_23317 [Anabarilius grahami]